VTIAIRPSCGCGITGFIRLILAAPKAKYFLSEGWTSPARGCRLICPSGKSPTKKESSLSPEPRRCVRLQIIARGKAAACVPLSQQLDSRSTCDSVRFQTHGQARVYFSPAFVDRLPGKRGLSRTDYIITGKCKRPHAENARGKYSNITFLKAHGQT